MEAKSTACPWCNKGHYRQIDPHEKQFGLSRVGSSWFSALECDYCGHIELFRHDPFARPHQAKEEKS